jgi:hypothetical protein
MTLVALLQERPGARLVHLRGRHQRGDVADRLAGRGPERDAHVVYDQVAVPARRVLHRGADHATASRAAVFPRSAELFAKRQQPSWQPGPIDRSSRSARRFGPRCRLNGGRIQSSSQQADGPAMLDAIARRIFP